MLFSNLANSQLNCVVLLDSWVDLSQKTQSITLLVVIVEKKNKMK